MPKPASGAQSLPALSPDDATLPKKKKSATPYFAVAAVLVAAAAGAVVWVTRTPATTNATATNATTTNATTMQTSTTAAAQQVPAAITAPTKPADPPPPVVEEVIVDSVPPGAKIFVDDVAVADTPEAIKVDKGKTKTVVLKKDGFVEQTQTIDPDKTHKLLVRLERVKKAAPSSGKGGGKVATKLPAPPPATPDPPVKASLPVVAQPAKTGPAQPPHKKKPVVDPYERVDAPAKKPADVLNPY
jgi:hypothetical protein